MSFDWAVFVCMFLIVGASYGVFAWLSWRETHRRWSNDLNDWALSRSMKRLRSGMPLPAPLDTIESGDVKILVAFAGKASGIYRMEAAGRGWNVMIRQLENQSLPLAIRPTEATHALSDLFGMEVSPTQPFGQRFTVLGLDVAGARRLAEGPVPALLPGDLGMIRVDKQLVIDFSQRPFDAIELGRMAALADQLAGIV